MIKSRFFEYLVAHNPALLAGLQKWHFRPGMAFNSTETWWGEKRPRPAPHEGVDLCLFEDFTGRVKEVDFRVQIPAIFGGKIVKLEKDFLGQSIFQSHLIFSPGGRQLHTAYGHTRPRPELRAGHRVAAGEILGALAPAPGHILSHLHLTVAWVPPALSPDSLSWQTLGQDPAITLLDPLSLLSP